MYRTPSLLKPNTFHKVLATSTSSRQLAIEPHQLLSLWQQVISARSEIEDFPDQPFYLLNSKVSDKGVYLTKQIKITHATSLPNLVHAIEDVNTKIPSIRETWLINSQIKPLSCTQRSMSQPLIINPQKVWKPKSNVKLSYKTVIEKTRRKVGEKNP